MKPPRESRVFTANHGRIEDIADRPIAVIGYGNQDSPAEAAKANSTGRIVAIAAPFS